MLPPVNGQHDDFVARWSKIDRIGKSRHHRATRVTVDPLKQEGIADDSRDQRFDGLAELAAQTRTTRFVPRVYGNGIALGLRPEDNFPRHPLPQQLGPNVGPRNGGLGVGHVFGPSPIELVSLCVGQLQFGISLKVGETVPQGHREIGPIARRKFEKVT